MAGVLGSAPIMLNSTWRRLGLDDTPRAGLMTSRRLRTLLIDPELPAREGWTRMSSGLWLLEAQTSDELLLETVRAAVQDEVVVSGAMACRRYGLRDAPATLGIDVLVEHRNKAVGGPLVRPHRTRRLPEALPRAGWPLAPVHRAVADAARWETDLRTVRALVLAALADRRIHVSPMREELARGPRGGGALLARTLDDWDRGARSAPEAEVADVAAGIRGLPPFFLNPWIWYEGVRLGALDLYVPLIGLANETDSVRHHGSDEGMDATFVRHETFTNTGLELAHISPFRFRSDPSQWASDFLGRAQRRRSVALPKGLVVEPIGPLLPLSARQLATNRREKLLRDGDAQDQGR